MNKRALARDVAQKTKLTQKNASKAVDAIIESISEGLAKGEKVTLFGFGVFKAVDRAKRDGVNPATGEKLEIPARKVLRFKPGKPLKEAVRS